MSETAAISIFAGIMGVGVAVWFLSLVKTLRIGQENAEQSDWLDKNHADPGVIFGERTVHGDPETLSKTLVRSLLQINIGMFGSLYEVTERTAKRVVLTKTGPLVCNQPAGLYFSEAVFNFEPLGGDAVRVSYQLGFARLVRLTRRINFGIALGIGLPLMLVIGAVMWFLVIPSEEPGVRWQVLQTLHIIHALWLPWMFIWIYSMGRRHAKTFVSNLLTTLEFAD